MAVHKTAYDTKACVGFQMTKTVEAVKRARADGQLEWLKGTDVAMVQGGASVVDAIPAFAHPMLFVDGEYSCIVVDVRSFGRWDQHQHSFKVTNPIEYQLAVHRAHLNQVWIKQSPSIMRDISALPLSIFASWISENMTKRYGLDPGEQYKVAIYAAVFYLSQFVQGMQYTFTEQERIRMSMAISKALHVSSKDVLDVLDADNDISVMNGEGCPVIETVYSFCNVVSGLSVRLKDFNPGVLYAILGNTWFGYNAKEMVAVALEHPPTWMAILLAALSERTYKNSGITKLLERRSNRAASESYSMAVLKLLSLNTTY
jgi:hypothetical protein